jgi:hypothetical protein
MPRQLERVCGGNHFASTELCCHRAIKARENREGDNKMLSTIIIVLLILALVGALPAWPYSSSWGYGPGGVLGTVLVVVLILALLGRI